MQTGPSLQELEREQAELEGQIKMMRDQRRNQTLKRELVIEQLLSEVQALHQKEQHELEEAHWAEDGSRGSAWRPRPVREAAAGPSDAMLASPRQRLASARGMEGPLDATASPPQGSPYSAVLRVEAAAAGRWSNAATSGTAEAGFEGLEAASGEVGASADRAAGRQQLGAAREAEGPPQPDGAGRAVAAVHQTPAVMWTPASNSRRAAQK